MVIALGGNALGKNLSEQMAAVQKTSKTIVKLVKDKHEIVLTHGNGPQVGLMLDIFDAYKINHDIEEFTMSVCVSITQGYIGYDLQNIMRETMLDVGISIPVATIITQVVVDEHDPAFNNPTKPIGPFLTDGQAKKREEKGDTLAFVDCKGYRQVVASPLPQHVVESESIKVLLEAGQMVIACGGGGIPVIEQGNHLKGVQAVIDKDFSSAKLAELIKADYFIILTAVEKVAINYGRENEQWLDIMTIEEAKKYLAEGHFGKGSMQPKVEAAIQFVENNPGGKALITSIDRLNEGLLGKTGTKIVR
jgi:carbamate kinase